MQFDTEQVLILTITGAERALHLPIRISSYDMFIFMLDTYFFNFKKNKVTLNSPGPFHDQKAVWSQGLFASGNNIFVF